MAINARWHQTHRMPRGAKLKERIAWHIAHAKACGCRDMPASIRALVAGGAEPAPAKRAAPAKRTKLAKKRAPK